MDHREKSHKDVKCTKIVQDGAVTLKKRLWMEEISLNCSQYPKNKKFVLFLKIQWQHSKKRIPQLLTGFLLGMVLSVCTCWFHNMVTLPPWIVSTYFGTCSYQCFLSNCIPVSLHMLKYIWAHTLSCLFVYCSFAIIGHADIMWSIVS